MGEQFRPTGSHSSQEREQPFKKLRHTFYSEWDGGQQSAWNLGAWDLVLEKLDENVYRIGYANVSGQPNIGVGFDTDRAEAEHIFREAVEMGERMENSDETRWKVIKEWLCQEAKRLQQVGKTDEK